KILTWNINTISLYINTQILPKICQLKRGTNRVREPARLVICTLENMKQNSSNRICRMTAIEQEVFECAVVPPAGIHPKGRDQIEKQRWRNCILYDCFGQFLEEWNTNLSGQRFLEFSFPIVQALQSGFFRVVPFVGNIV